VAPAPVAEHRSATRSGPASRFSKTPCGRGDTHGLGGVEMAEKNKIAKGNLVFYHAPNTRSWGTRILLDRSGGPRTKIFDSLEAGAAWLMAELGSPAEAPGLARSVRSARA